MTADLKVKLKIDADTGDVTSELGDVSKGIKKTGAAAETTGRKAADMGKGFDKATQAAFGFNQILEAGGRLASQLEAIIALGDEYRLLSGRIAAVTGDQEAANRTMAALTDIALSTHAPLRDTAELYARLAQNTTDAGYSQEQLLDFTKAVNSAMAVSGTKAAEAGGALQQLSQALASGTLRGDEFNSVNEQMPVLLSAVAKHLQVNKGELRGMAEQGKLTADVVMQATLAMGDTWAEQARALPSTMGKAITDLNTAWQAYLGTSDELTATSQVLAGALGLLTDNLAAVAGVASDAAIAALPAVFAAVARATANWATAQMNAAGAAKAQVAAAEEQAAALQRTLATQQTSAKAAYNYATAMQAQTAATLAQVEALAAEQPYLVRTASYQKSLAAARAENAAATRALSSASKEYAAANAAVAASQTTAAAASGRLGAAFRGMLDPMNTLQAGFAGLMGYEFGQWLWDQSDIAKQAGTVLLSAGLGIKNTLLLITEGFAALAPGGDSPADAWARFVQRQADDMEILSQQFRDFGDGLYSTGEAMDATAQSASSAGEAMGKDLKDGTDQAIKSLKDAADQGKAVKEIFATLLDPDAFADGQQAMDALVDAMVDMGEQAGLSAGEIEKLFGESLGKTATDQLQTLQDAAQAAVDKSVEAGDAAAGAVSQSVAAAVKELGVLALSGVASAQDIKDAWQGALRTADSRADLDLLSERLQDLAAMGVLSAGELEAALKQVGARAEQIGADTAAGTQEMGKEAAAAAAILESTLQAALKRLGIEADTAGQDAVAAFKLLASNSLATAEQIDQGLGAALARIDTEADLSNLKQALADAGRAGKIAGKDMEDALDAVKRKANELAAQLDDDLGAAFERFGIQSKAELVLVAEEAQRQFDLVIQSGQAAMEGVSTAAEQTRKEIIAAFGADSPEIKAFDAKLESLGVKLEDIGKKAKQAGRDIKEGLRDAGTAVDEVDAKVDLLDNKLSKLPETIRRSTKAMEDFKVATVTIGGEVIGAFGPYERALDTIRDQFEGVKILIGQVNNAPDGANLDRYRSQLETIYAWLESTNSELNGQRDAMLREIEQAFATMEAQQQQTNKTMDATEQKVKNIGLAFNDLDRTDLSSLDNGLRRINETMQRIMDAM